MEISVADAARRLDLSPATVRRLAESGELSARKVAGAWLVDDSDVAAHGNRRRGRGRPLSARSAWAILDLLADRPLDRRSRSEVARAVRRAREADALDPGDLASRAKVLRLRGAQGVERRLLDDLRLVASGVSARSTRVGIAARGQIEGYVRPDDVEEVVRAYGLRKAPANRANVILRVPACTWPFDEDEREAPPAVVAADVLDAGDSRSVSEARRILAELAKSVE